MGVSNSAYVVYGVKVKRSDRIPSQVQKFNENDGTPYMKNIQKTGWILPDGSTLLQDDPKVTDDMNDAYDIGQFGFVGDYYESDNVLGYVVVRIGGYSDSQVKRIPKLSAKEEQDVLDELKKLGITEPPEYHLISYMS